MSTPLEREAYNLLQAYKDEVDTLHLQWDVKPGDLVSGRAIFAADPEIQVAVIRATLLHPPRAWHAAHALLSQLARRNLPYTTEDVHAILRAIRKETDSTAHACRLRRCCARWPVRLPIPRRSKPAAPT